MKKINVIITGVTGMVGEGVLLECARDENVARILVLGRKHYEFSHPKVQELLLSDFSEINKYADILKEFDACFFCAGVSSIGENEESFTKKTYDFVVPFATTFSQINPDSVFIYVSGNRTDSTEKGKVMWARVKGRTENALMRLPFKNQFNFRPAIMTANKGQKNVNVIYRILAPIISPFFSAKTLNLSQVGRAMVNAVLVGYSKQIMEVDDIDLLSKVKR